MKKLMTGMVAIIIGFMCPQVHGQERSDQVKSVPSYEVSVGYHHTVNLIFPYAIKSVDRGSKAVLVQKAKGVDNVLQAKAAEENFTATNLSIVTSDGKFYSIIVRYMEVPSELTVQFGESERLLLNGEPVNAEQLEKAAWNVHGTPAFMKLKYRDQFTGIWLQGAFLSTDQLWLKMKLTNHSQIDYRPQYVRFFLRDKKRSKRTALQEKELVPNYTGTPVVIPGQGSAILIRGFPPFTVPKHQQLIIQLADESGGRVMRLVVKSNRLLRARKLPL